MRLILYGSRAIKYWFPEFPREPVDWDFIVSEPNYKRSDIPGVEYKHIPPVLSYLKSIGDNEDVCSPDVLCTIKASHLFWDINWNKHFNDFQYLYSNGAAIIDELFFDLYEFWKNKHGNNRRSDLSMNKEDFFKNKINYEIDHDYIHTLLNPIPTYTKILKDGAEVEVDEHKFNRLFFSEKIELVEEEVMVMAWERGRKTNNYEESYKWMFKKFFMHHAPIWEALFILRNWDYLSYPKFDYFSKIENGLIYDRERV